MSGIWNGAQFETAVGSDTDESDSEQPLTEPEQIVAILNVNATRPPPLPVNPEYAVSTAMAVRTYLRTLPHEKRTIAHDHAMQTPVVAHKVESWIEQQLGDRRSERTLRYAFCVALNPNRPNNWIAKKAQGNSQVAGIAKGMALHLRCHPFTRSDVQRGWDLLGNYCEHRARRDRARLVKRKRSLDSLDAAVVLIGFHSTARHFGAHRYRYVM